MDDEAPTTEASQPSLRLSSLPAFTAASLPKHLRHPSLPPPSGPLPRPPSVLENEEIGARLSASSPPGTGSIRSKLTAFPFPTIPERSASPAAPIKYNQNANDSIRDRLFPSNAPPLSSPSPSQLSPSNFVTGSTDTPVSAGRQPSAHTQASSDALGEDSRLALRYDLATFPRLNRYSQQSSLDSANESIYSQSSGRGTLGSHPQEHQSNSFLGPGWEHKLSAAPNGDAEDDARSTSRLSRLSYISSGAAFIVSEDSGISQRGSSQSYLVENIFTGLGGPPGLDSIHTDVKMLGTQRNSHLAVTLGNPKDPAVRVHPADNRFEHTYRIRRASEAEDPIYVPIYTFEPPGKFPDRTRLTAPKVAPRFLNHTPRNFSLPGRPARISLPRSSSDSAEMLLGDSGADLQIPVPPASYGAQHRNRQSLGISLTKLSPITALDSSTKNRSGDAGTPRSDKHPQKETARQRFEREHSHYFHDLSHLEKSQWPNSPVAPEIQIHGPRHSFSSKYAPPSLSRPEDAYVGDYIDPYRWPDRYKRQKRIGRSLLCVCLLMPPLWLIMAVGLLDNLVIELTDGEIWSVGRSEKVVAAWFGGVFCFALIVAITAVGIVIL